MLANINLFIYLFFKINGTPLIGPHYLGIKALQRVSTYKTSSRWCYTIKWRYKYKCTPTLQSVINICDKHIRGKHASTLQRTFPSPPKFSSNLTQKSTSSFPQESTTTSSGLTASSNFRPQFKSQSTFYPLVQSTKLNILTRKVPFGTI